MLFENDPDVMENLPDNSHLHTNLFVKGLDPSLTAEDLHLMFGSFGDIKSCKVAQDPATAKSKGYGFVWFTTESACKSALLSKQLPYQVELYQTICLRQVESLSALEETPNKSASKSVVIAGYPRSYNEQNLRSLIGSETIESIKMGLIKAEVTFKSNKLAQQALIIDGVPIEGKKLSVKPLGLLAKSEPTPSGLNNLYVSQLDKSLSEADLRRSFARFGKVSSFKLVSKAEYPTNIAYVAFANPDHAKKALEHAGVGTVMWHKSKTQCQSDVLKDINTSLNLLEELNLFADPSSFKKLVPKIIAGLDPDGMERLQNIFDLIKVDL